MSIPRWSVSHGGDRLGGLLSWDVQAREGLVVVVVDGELDAYTAPWLGERLWPLAGSGPHLVIDLTRLRFLGCAGVTLFLRLRRLTASAGGSLHLAGASTAASRVITVSRLDGILAVADTVADVLIELGQDRPAQTREVIAFGRRRDRTA